MSAFGGYAKYYDLFYADKDYPAECAFVRAVIGRHAPGARTLLDLGCGSARHAVEFAKAGMSVTGVDISDGMIARAQDRLREQPAEIRQRIDLAIGDAARYRPAQVFDAVVALFHVVDYQTTDEALAGIFATARRALADHGVFVFDFWHGPAVLAQRPQRRQKRVESDGLIVTRTAEPVLDEGRNIVDVRYTLTVESRGGAAEEIRECHAMRYLFPAEIAQFAAAAGFDIVESGAWLGGPLSERTWSGYAAARPR